MTIEPIRAHPLLADPRGDIRAVEQLLDAADELDVHAVAVVGDLGAGRDKPAGYAALFRALRAGGRQAFWVPGPADAPVEGYLREAYNVEIVHPFLHGVHGTAAFSSDHLVFAGHGGEVSDEPGGPRDEHERLRYPRWEPEYRLKLLRGLKPRQLVLLFATPPAHKYGGGGGSQALSELVNTYRPRIVVCGGEPGSFMLGRSLVVAPGPLTEGRYAVADVREREAELEELGAGGLAGRA